MIDLNDCYIASQVGIGICTAAQISQTIRQHVERIIDHMYTKFFNKFTMLALDETAKLEGYLVFFEEEKYPNIYRFIRAKSIRLMRQQRDMDPQRQMERNKKYLTRRFNSTISACGVFLFAFILFAPFFKEQISGYIDPYIFAIICCLCLAPLISWVALITHAYIELALKRLRLNLIIFWGVGIRFHLTRVFNSVEKRLWKNSR